MTKKVFDPVYHGYFKSNASRFLSWRVGCIRSHQIDPVEEVATNPNLTDEHLLACGCPCCKEAYTFRQHGHPNADDTSPVFAAIVQPNYIWQERPVTVPFGVTGFPKRKRLPPRKPVEADIIYPGGNTPLVRAIKLHELLHARFSPDVLHQHKSAPPVVVQIAEDIRLARIARDRGLLDDRSWLHYPEWTWNRSPEGGYTNADVAIRFMATYGQPLDEVAWDTTSLDAFLSHSGLGLDQRALKIMTTWAAEVERALLQASPAAQFDALAKATRVALQKIGGEAFLSNSEIGTDYEVRKGPGFGRGENGFGPPLFMPTQALPGDGAEGDEWAVINEFHADKATGSLGLNYAAWDYSWLRHGVKPDEEMAKNYSLDPTEHIGWGQMVIATPPLARNFKALVKRPGIASPEGPLPKYFSRWFGDKQIFERKGRRRGGTLLIDASSSMGWAWEKTRDLIEATPAMTIAIYSGGGIGNAKRNGKKDRWGRLTVIARDGKLIAEDWDQTVNGHGGGNIVDGPALSWLCRQPRPRVWVSDGGVTGCYDNQTMSVMNDAIRLCRLGGIRRYRDPDAAVRVFAEPHLSVPPDNAGGSI